MLQSTRHGVKAICVADPDITSAQINAALQELECPGNHTSERSATTDRILSRKQVAALLNCSPKSVTDYARRGLIKSFALGKSGKRANGYSELSVQELLKKAGC